MKIKYVQNKILVEKEVTEEQIQFMFDACLKIRFMYKDAELTAMDAFDDIVKKPSVETKE